MSLEEPIAERSEWSELSDQQVADRLNEQAVTWQEYRLTSGMLQTPPDFGPQRAAARSARGMRTRITEGLVRCLEALNAGQQKTGDELAGGFRGE
jgi:hypothetical protein